jgi:hypothetical protein
MGAVREQPMLPGGLRNPEQSKRPSGNESNDRRRSRSQLVRLELDRGLI